MKLITTAKLSLKNLLRNKRRSFLTMLGIIIGVMSVVLVMSVGEGAQSLIVNQIKQKGTDLIAILAGASEEEGPPASTMGIVITTLTDDDRKALLNKNNVRHAEEASSYITGNDVLRWQNNERSVTYTGTTASYESIEKIKVIRGRFFDEAEETSAAHVMVIGSEIAEEIFGNQDPIGENVKLKGKNFKIIGLLGPEGGDFFNNPDNAVLIPLEAAQRDLLGIHHVAFIRLRIDNETYLRDSIEEIKQTLLERHEDEDFSVRNLADALAILETVTDALRYFLIAVAAISLFVGGVGIMNIMLIAVKEKTREIGLRKAVGARNTDVMVQFLIESVSLTMVGGIVGVIIGLFLSYLAAYIVQYLGYDYDFVISSSSIIVGIGVAGLIGLLFGLVPAKKAANLSPIDALRYE